MLEKFLISSNKKDDCINTHTDILNWINDINKNINININPSHLSNNNYWFYDSENGEVTNKNDSFFKIKGICVETEVETITQPIIIQKEIGYLGVICKEFNGVLYFLMQAKIEPGNINKVQISPTIQATKSNFLQKHGGRKPHYSDYFDNSSKYNIIVDQLQSEQSSRFYGKRNRNIIIEVSEEVEVYDSHMWMTLGQLKELLKEPNVINMDTRTVLSCIPYSLFEPCSNVEHLVHDKSLYNSMFASKTNIPQIYNYINDYKMFLDKKSKFINLHDMKNWTMSDLDIRCNEDYPFSVIYCDIELEGREVGKWFQPLFKAEKIAILGLFTTVVDNIRLFLVKCTPEIGCLDDIELGATLQLESKDTNNMSYIDKLFLECYNSSKYNKFADVLLSEEGGRFYHEQNSNIIIEIPYTLIKDVPQGYFWTNYKTLNMLTQVNNCLNIQLRNLLALLEV